MAKKLTTEEFIKKARKKHGDKYDYSKSVYTKSHEKILIGCQYHGFFWQTATQHTNRGYGCPECYKKNRGYSTEDFIKLARKKHGDKYDYSRVVYKGSTSKVLILCNKHGGFFQEARNHLKGSNCPKCSRIYNNEIFINSAKKIHGNRYDYSRVVYKGSHSKVLIVCNKHGEFFQYVSNHLKGANCPKCSLEDMSDNTETFIKKAKKIHGNRYDYSRVVYKGTHSKIRILCNVHGEFEQQPTNHLNGTNCPKCANTGISKAEKELLEFIKSNYDGEIIENSKSIISPLELDIYLPDLKLAFEYNGLYWHSDDKIDKFYHAYKTEACNDKDIKLMHIRSDHFEDNLKSEIIKSMILNKLGKSNRIYARKCKIINIDYKEAKSFYNVNHIQGSGICESQQSHIALEYENKIVMVMSFDYKQNYLAGLCSLIYNNIIGGASRLINQINTSEFYTFINLNYGGKSDFYKSTRFNIISETITPPNYFYTYNGNYAGSQQKFMKHKLPKLFDDYDGTPEKEFMKNKGYHIYYDAGNLKLTLSR